MSWLKAFRRLLQSPLQWGLFVLLLTVTSATLWGRAGGGDGYSGGGGGGGGFGGGGFSGGSGFSGGFSGGGGGIGVPVHLSASAVLLIILVLIVAVVIQMRYAQRETAEAQIIVDRGAAIDQENIDTGLEAIGRRDPDFHPEAFIERVQNAFQQIQDAWMAQDVKPVRHFVSDGIFERYSLQLEMMKASGIVDRMANLTIKEVTIAAVNSDPCFDAIDVYFCISAADWYIDSSGKTVYGSHSPETFVEYWTFIRRPGAKTKAGGGLTEHICPNCGAPLDIVDRCECPTCKAVVNSGEFDWVLTEITQEIEWQNRPERATAGYDSMLARDPAFNLRHLEDRVSVMFYRWIAAQFFADPKYLRKLSDDAFLTQNAGFFQPQSDGSHLFYADAAVGRVETAEVIGSTHVDQVRVQVKWSGHRARTFVPSLIVPDFASSHLFNQEFVLFRQSGVKSSDRNVLASSHCPNCGAPETFTDSGKCEYCQAPLNDGSRDWVLTDIRNFGGFAVSAAPAVASSDENGDAASPMDDAALLGGIGFLDEKDGDSLIAAAAALMLADGAIEPKEEQLLQRFAQQRKMPPARLHAIVESVRSGDLTVALPDSREKSIYFLRCLILLCLSDGRIVPAERKLLCNLAQQMGIPFKEVEMLIREEKARLLAGE